jgi:predicted secreted protein
MNWLTWFFILYYPLLLLILAIGYRVRRSRKSDIAVGCAVMAVVGAPFAYTVVRIAYLVLFMPTPKP